MEQNVETMAAGMDLASPELPHEESYFKFLIEHQKYDGWSIKAAHLAFEYRDDYRKEYGYALPTMQAVKKIASYGPVVEIGAARGYWARLISFLGQVEVVAFDDGSWKLEAPWYPIQEGTEDAASDYPNHTLFLCWPPYDTPMAYRAARNHYEAGGQVVAYVGEGAGGCTGDDSFHEFMNEKYHEPETIIIPQLPMLYDRLYIYERK